jgi:hypothetical protein
MTASFIDTTVLIDISQSRGSGKISSENFVNANRPAEAPFYALRELLAGHVRYLCDTHNILTASKNPAEALVAILTRFPTRASHTQAVLLARLLSNFFANRGAITGAGAKRDGLHQIMMMATRVWRRANHHKLIDSVQQLACFNNGDLQYRNGNLRGPNDSFNCSKREKCAAAGWLREQEVQVAKVVEALHPKNLEGAAKSKREISHRRSALKLLIKKGHFDFNKGKCRALGDAYFAIMCPQKSIMATTNIGDFEPMCKVLRKQLQKP